MAVPSTSAFHQFRPRRARRIACVIVTALFACPALEATAQTTANGQIAYVASGPSTIPFGSPTQTDVWVMNADGSNPRNLTNTSEVDEFTPAWSPDGTRIAYVSGAFTQTLMIMDADGGNPTTIATGATYPTWNPAGTEIAYVRGRDGLPVNIVIRTLATGVEREVTLHREEACTACAGSGAAPGTGPERCPACRGNGRVAHSQGLFTITTTCPQCRGAGRVIKDRCRDCGGTGRTSSERKIKVRIPPDVDAGNTLRVGGAGGAGQDGSPAGDLYVVVDVGDDPRFKREGDDLVHELAISVPDAVLGRKMVLEGLLAPVKIEIPKGSQPGDALRVVGQGMPRLGGSDRGDLWVRLDVEIPRDPPRAVRKLYEQIRETEAH